jgi:hypothetical protein
VCNRGDRPEILDVDISRCDRNAQFPFELDEQLYEPERIEDAGVEQIGVGRRNLNVQGARKQPADALAQLLRIAGLFRRAPPPGGRTRDDHRDGHR